AGELQRVITIRIPIRNDWKSTDQLGPITIGHTRRARCIGADITLVLDISVRCIVKLAYVVVTLEHRTINDHPAIVYITNNTTMLNGGRTPHRGPCSIIWIRISDKYAGLRIPLSSRVSLIGVIRSYLFGPNVFHARMHDPAFSVTVIITTTVVVYITKSGITHIIGVILDRTLRLAAL